MTAWILDPWSAVPRFMPCDDDYTAHRVVRPIPLAVPRFGEPINAAAEERAVWRTAFGLYALDCRVILFVAEGDGHRAGDLVNIAAGAIALCLAGVVPR